MNELLQKVPFGLTGDDLIVTLAGLSAVLTVVALWFALVPKEYGAARARAIINKRLTLKAAALAPNRRAQTLRTYDFMHSVVERLNLMRSKHGEGIARKLARAGMRSKQAAIVFLFVKATMPLVMAMVGVLLIFVFPIMPLSQPNKLLACAACVGLGYFLPSIYISNATTKRKDKLRKSLPDALDLMVICAEAGLSLDAALQRVSKELGRPFPELADEFSLTAVELGFMPERRRALENLADRTDLAGIKGLVNTLLQSDKYGTPLAQSLRVLSAELRHERLMKAEEKAAKLPAVLTVPMILFILPPLFIVLIGPAILSIMDAFKGL